MGHGIGASKERRASCCAFGGDGSGWRGVGRPDWFGRCTGLGGFGPISLIVELVPALHVDEEALAFIFFDGFLTGELLSFELGDGLPVGTTEGGGFEAFGVGGPEDFVAGREGRGWVEEMKR